MNMPPKAAPDSYNDYAELEIAHGGQSADEIADAVSLNEALPDNLKSKAFRSKITSSKANKSTFLPFLAAVKIDLKRRKPIGLFELFNTWLELGNKYWLNPMDKERGLGVLEEVLFKYQGDVQVLSPFIELLVNIAKNVISPRSFVEYVILPRMYQDYDWRKWQEKHLEALQIVADLIDSIKERPPFNQEHLGSGKTRLAKDVVLVRYIGRPIAQFRLHELHDSVMLENYISAWQKISLQDPLCLYFMRNNALHFFYSMSGRIDMVQLIAIIEQLPAIEQAFSAAFPNGITKLANIQSMNLYDYDIENALYARRQQGYHSIDFTVEIKAFFEIVKALLEKPTGVYLCAYYAGLLKRYKDPGIAETISRLVRIVDDRGGMHIYKWHTKKLLSKPKNDMPSYLDYIEGTHGCDPEYPQLESIFRDEEQAREDAELANLFADLGLERHFTGIDKISCRELLDAFIQEHPDTAELITDYQRQLLSGLDRQWTGEYIKRLDDLNIHRLLLRSAIRGIGTGFSISAKSSSFADLFEKYGTVHSQMKINAKTNFIMPVKQLILSSADQDAIARKQVNLKLVEKVWNSICNPEPLSIGNLLTYINKWSINLNEPLEKIFSEKVSLEKMLSETSEEDIIEKTEANIAKQDKAIAALQEKKQNFTAIMDEFDTLNDEQKFILALVLAGTAGKSDDEFSGYVTGLLLRRYKESDSIVSRLNFLWDDISIDVLSYQQFVYLLNLLDTLFFNLGEDKKIISLLENDTVLQKILNPYLITKKKQVSLDALDAAVKKMTGYASMQADRAKWQGILDKIEQKDGKYFHDMEIYTSKTFIDSYYGDMGGICLSAQPQQILKPGFFVQRLLDNTEKQIIGMSILYLSSGGFSSYQVQSNNFWQAFAFNPLSSVLSHYSEEQQLRLYLQFRVNMEKIAWATKLPVVLSGIDTSWGLISNNGYFCNLIRKYEYSKPTARKVFNAKGLSVYYSEAEYAVSLVIIDPRGYEQAADLSQIPTFYAYRELFNPNYLHF
jgi:hypothetical protein